LTDSLLFPGERADDLLIGGLKVIQSPQEYCFSIDSVLLANFAVIKPGDKVMDLGTGCGVIPILLSAKTKAEVVYGLEIQPSQADRGKRSVLLNGIEDRVHIIQGDLKHVKYDFQPGVFNVVVTNPPYRAAGSGKTSPNQSLAVSRQEVLCTLSDVIEAAAWLLNPGGRFYMVYRPQRLVELFYGLRCFKIEPKKLRIVHPSPGKPANMMLVEAVRNGEPGLTVSFPLTVYGEDGAYTDELKKIYFGAGGDRDGS
jgi:tRNA1Val (adenine37-N6)-methyltransferase